MFKDIVDVFLLDDESSQRMVVSFISPFGLIEPTFAPQLAGYDLNNLTGSSEFESEKIYHILHPIFFNAIAKLAGDGFMTYIEQGEKKFKYATLTDAGRLLKEKGNMIAYNAFLDKQKSIEKHRKEEEKMIREINLNIAKHTLKVNFWIMIGAIVAAVYYLLEILRIQYHLGLPLHVFFR